MLEPQDIIFGQAAAQQDNNRDQEDSNALDQQEDMIRQIEEFGEIKLNWESMKIQMKKYLIGSSQSRIPEKAK